MFAGTNSEQDARFSDKMKKLVKTSKFPRSFNKKVSLKKVQLSVFRPWITRRITELLGVEDDIVIEFALSILDQETCDPKVSQIHLTGFLEKNAPLFMQELWDLLLDAQENPNGIPTKFLEEKKEELKRQKIEEEIIKRRIARERQQESQAREEARLLRIKEREKNGTNEEPASRDKEVYRRSSERRSPSPSRHRDSDRYRSSRDRSSRSRERSSRRDHRDSSERDREYRSEHRHRDRDSSRHRRDRDREPRSSRRYENDKDSDSKPSSCKRVIEDTNMDDPALIYDDIQDLPIDQDRSTKRHR